METARVECLRSIGIDFAELVKLGCDLPVVDLSIRYHRAIRLGQTAVIKTRMNEITGVRLDWDYRLECMETKELCLTSNICLVAIDLEKGKIMRQLPPAVKDTVQPCSRRRRNQSPVSTCRSRRSPIPGAAMPPPG